MSLEKDWTDYQLLLDSEEKLRAFRKKNGYTEIPFQCGFCMTKFPGKYQLGKHRNKDHGIVSKAATTVKMYQKSSQKVQNFTILTFDYYFSSSTNQRLPSE